MSAQLEQAKVNIDKMRLEMKTDNRKFLVQLLSGTAAAMAAGAGILGLILHLTGKL